jgi:hypothetical protein
VGVRLVFGSKYAVVQILAITGLERLSFEHSERSRSIGTPLSPQEDGVLHLPATEAARKLIQMCDE